MMRFTKKYFDIILKKERNHHNHDEETDTLDHEQLQPCRPTIPGTSKPTPDAHN